MAFWFDCKFCRVKTFEKFQNQKWRSIPFLRWNENVSGGISLIIEIKSCFQQFILHQNTRKSAAISTENFIAAKIYLLIVFGLHLIVSSFFCLMQIFRINHQSCTERERKQDGIMQRKRDSFANLLNIQNHTPNANYKRKKLYPFCVCAISCIVLNVTFSHTFSLSLSSFSCVVF